ncbi:MAG: conjugal transfer protein TrbJ, partial [Rhodomicrobium sp.]|nr:conjugal transfer protein TrbJ [Rhodomicrobium sp.]
MEKQLRAVALGLIAIAAASAANIGTAHAQAVYCTNCSSEFTQLMNLARLIDQLGTQGNILKTNINQFRNMTVNTTPFSSLQWGNAAGELQSVNSIL